MPELKIYRGPQATGKSTAAAQLVKQGWMLVNKDSLRKSYPHLNERQIHETCISMMNVARDNQWNIVNDNVNFSQKTVDGYKAWAYKNGYTITEQWFGRDIPVDVAIMRDRQRGENGGHTVGRSVIIQSYMDFGLFVPPIGVWNRAVLFDIDGTLANIKHRQNLLPNWRAFFEAMEDDTVNEPVARAMHLYGRAEYTVILMSGRPANYRAVTEKWLCDNGLDGYFALFMRPFNDSRQDNVMKSELYHNYVKPYFDIECVYDDRDQVVKMWRELGLTCFQCAEGNF